MHRLRDRILFTLLGAWCAAAAVHADEPGPVTILFTSDVFGHVSSVRFREHRDHHGGLLRCASVIRAERDAGADVLLIDGGGLLRGSPESRVSRGMLPAEAGRWLAFDLRLAATTRPSSLYREACAYLDGYVPRLGQGAWPGSDPVHDPFAPRCVHPVKVAGLTIGFVGWTDPGMGGGVDRRVDESRLRRDLQAVRAERPDLIVLLLYTRAWSSEGALQRGIRGVLRRYPDPDLVLSGGCPAPIQPFQSGRAWVAQPDDRGLSVERIRIGRAAGSGKAGILGVEKLSVSAEVPEDAVLRRNLGVRLGRVEHRLDAVVGNLGNRIEGWGATPGQSGMQTLLARSVADHLEARVVLCGGLRGSLAAGPVRFRDVMRVIPDRNDWVTLWLTAAELRDVLHENLAFLETSDFMGIYGGSYRARPGVGEGCQVEDFRLGDGSKPHGRERIAVAFPADTLWGTSEPRPVLQRLVSLPVVRAGFHVVDTPEVVANYVRVNQPVVVYPARGMILDVDDQQ